jgi:hypothetical protein
MTRLDRLCRYARCIGIGASLVLVSPVVPLAPASASVASVNPVIAWDINAQTAIWDIAQQQPQQVSGRSFAIVSGAVYDAVNAIAGTPYQPYLVAPRASGSESVDAAVAAAAHGVLTALFPDQEERLRVQYQEYLAAIPDGRSKRGGIAVGAQTAAAMIAARQNDGSSQNQPWPVGNEPGQWRPTPPGFGNNGKGWGQVRPFLVPDATAFRTAGPPALTSRAYARDVNEIKRVGSATSTVRTADQTEAAVWWHDRRSTNWEIKRQLATTQRLNILQTARLFAMVDLAVADAQIACNDGKELWNQWRPISAIREADTDGNPRTVADPDWTPLLVTPPNPDYPSGANCNEGAREVAYAFFFGRDDVTFSGFSVDSGTRRYFRSFSQATAEVVEARVWGGIHLRSSDVHGAQIGEDVARHVTRHHFRPLR